MKNTLLSYSRKKVFLLTGAFFIWLILLLFIRMYFVEPQMIVSRHYRQKLTLWHPEHNGLKIAILSDIHLKNTPQDFARLHHAVDLINQERPALVFLLGDYLFGNKRNFHLNPLPEKMAAELARLNPATFAILGNHDNAYGRRTITRVLKEAGITVLDCEFKTLMLHGKKLQILGLPDSATRGYRLKEIHWPESDNPTIVLVHNPILFGVLQLPYELMLSGHTHGGQIRLPFIGAFGAEHLFLSEFKVGWERKQGRVLLHNSGFGTTGPRMRLLCPPEVVFLTLYQKKVLNKPESDIVPSSNFLFRIFVFLFG